MQPNARFRRNILIFYGFLGALVLMGAGPIVASRLIERDTPGARTAAVIVGVGSMLPWLWAVFAAVRRGDEFVRRMHLVAAAFAFGTALVLTSAMDWLERAGFIAPPPLTLLWLGFLILWVIALIGAKRYFERPQ